MKKLNELCNEIDDDTIKYFNKYLKEMNVIIKFL